MPIGLYGGCAEVLKPGEEIKTPGLVVNSPAQHASLLSNDGGNPDPALGLSEATPVGRRKGTSSLLRRVGSEGFLGVSIGIAERAGLVMAAGMEVPAPYLACSDTTPVSTASCPVAASWGWKSGLPLGLCCCGWGEVTARFRGVWLE